MHFVNDVDLEWTAGRRVTHVVPEVTDVVHARVRCRIDLKHIKTVAAHDLLAGIALSARLACRPLLAIQCLRKNPGDGRLAHAARTHEQVGMRHPVRLDGVLQGLGDMLLPNDFIKPLWPPLPRKNLVCHGKLPEVSKDRRYSVTLSYI